MHFTKDINTLDMSVWEEFICNFIARAGAHFFLRVAEITDKIVKENIF